MRWCRGPVAAAVLLAVSAAPAWSAPAWSAPAWSAPVAPDRPPATSSYEAGLLVTSTPHSASTRFVVPAFSCPIGVQGLSLGVGNGPHDAAPTLFAGVRLLCVGGNPFIEPLAVIGGTESTGGPTVRIGDVITASVQQSKGTETAVATDVTAAQKITATGKPATPDERLLFGAFIVFANGQPAFPVQFSGSVPFSHNMFGGQPLGATPVVRVTLPILSWAFTTSKLSHDSFTVTNTQP